MHARADTATTVTKSSANGAARTRGRHQRGPREHVSQLQRSRILNAAVTIATEHGLEATTVTRIVSVAKVSRKSFYSIFEDRNDCLLAVTEAAVAQASARAQNAWQAEDRWADRVRAGLASLLQFCDEEPQLARVCVLHSNSAHPPTARRRRQVVKQLASTLDTGRDDAREPPSPLTAESLTGGALAVVLARLLKPNSGRLLDQLNMLMSFLVLPYLGAAAARKELTRQPPTRIAARSRNATTLHPHTRIDMRLTYRTMRVLSAISDQPGLSNRKIGERAGVTDPGQISKLLARLAGLALIENIGAGHLHGASNAWRLTPQGEHLERTTAAGLLRAWD
jgi:AcrR family transcriptional regulator